MHKFTQLIDKMKDFSYGSPIRLVFFFESL